MERGAVARPRVRFNRWEFEPLFFLLIPFVTILSVLGGVAYLVLRDWLGDPWAGLALALLITGFLLAGWIRILRVPRRERSP